VRKYFAQDAMVILESCSTGKGIDPIAQTLATVLGVRVIAPDAETNIHGFRFDRTGKLSGVMYEELNGMRVEAREFVSANP
jgi:hypothetical protein